MTWDEFKEVVERSGVQGETRVWRIDVLLPEKEKVIVELDSDGDLTVLA
jgi:hypothetical protein